MEMDFKVGTVVYAKLKGYPWWPARIEKEENLPKEVHSKKPKGRVTDVTGVKFFGTKDYGWVNRNDIKPFVQNEAEETLEKLRSNKRANKLLEKSIRDAFDPSSLDDDDDNSNADIDSNDNGSPPNNENNEKNNSRSLSSSSSIAKNKAQSKGKKISKKKFSDSSTTTTTATNERKRKGRQTSETSLTEDGKSNKKRKANSNGASTSDIGEDGDEAEITEDTDVRKNSSSDKIRKKSSSSSSSSNNNTTVREANDSNKLQEDPSVRDHSSPTENQDVSTKSNKLSEYERLERKLLRLRRRLQKLVLKDDGIEPQDVEKVNETFEEIEQFPVSVLMLRVTKVGKLMREISRRKFDYDPCNIVEKSTNLISRWQTLLEENPSTIQTDNNVPSSPKAESNIIVAHASSPKTEAESNTIIAAHASSPKTEAESNTTIVTHASSPKTEAESNTVIVTHASSPKAEPNIIISHDSSPKAEPNTIISHDSSPKAEPNTIIAQAINW